MSTAAPSPDVPAPSASPPPPEPPLPSRVTGLSCPSCGGALEVDAGLRVIVCPYCAATLLATGDIGIRRFAVEPEVDAEAARSATRRWLASGWNKDRRLPRQAELGEAFLCFLPFYRLEADVVGLTLGTEERTRTVGSGNQRRIERYEVDVERTVERHFDVTFPAVNVAEWGVEHVDLQGDRLVPYEPDALARRGMVFPPTRSEVETREAALSRFRDAADPRKGLKRVRFHFLDTLRVRLTVIYYPLWVVRYRFEQRSYQVLVDAQDGRVAYGKAPGNDLYRAVTLVFAQAVACFVPTTALQVMAGSEGSGWLLLVAVLFALAVLGWGWKRFRWGGEVVEGYGLEPDRGLDLGPLSDLVPGFLPGVHPR